jgi:hypothetical protein
MGEKVKIKKPKQLGFPNIIWHGMTKMKTKKAYI